MNKLAVTQTVMDSLSFGWKRIGTTIRMAWIGFILYLVLYIGGAFLLVGGAYFEHMSGESLISGDEAAVAEYMVTQGTITVLALFAALVLVPFYVVMYRIASGDIEAPGGIGYFNFGGREVRFIIGYLVMMLVFLLFMAVVFAPFGISLAMAINGESGAMGAVSALLALVGIVAMVWFSLRLSTFLPAVAIEDRLVLMRAFRMTGGNVWRILGAFLLFILIILALYMAVYLGAVIIGLIVFFIGAALVESGGQIVAYILGIPVGLALIVAMIAFTAFLIGAQMSLAAKIYAQLKDNTN